ncbi:MAG: polysaccharide deacetylase family protein [Candidatus Thiodiazotropha sp. (ex Semelilucina semeliformis)]|nr:polysaccharide deacetylase family protein [Candidatus Thiodiazotropha sp. (ex Semelilucina semeliformis)]
MDSNIKHLLLKTLYYSGFIRVWSSLNKNKITILTLHGVMDAELESEWEPLRPRTSRKLFDDTLSMAARYFDFVSLDQAIGMLKGVTPLKPNSCVVTFDDGQLNNLAVAWPILKKHKIPVVFYPTTGALDKGEPYWFDRLDFAIQQPGLDGLEVNVGHSQIRIDQSSRQKLAGSLSKLTKSLKLKDQSDSDFQREVNGIIGDFENKSGKSINDVTSSDLWSSPMSWDDIVQCSMIDGITIGSHTVNHVRLPFVGKGDLASELTESKSALEERMKLSCIHFCYPNGDWDEHSARVVENAGYESAVTTDVGWNEVGDNLYTLKRYSFPVGGTALKALFSITGILHFMSGIRKG